MVLFILLYLGGGKMKKKKYCSKNCMKLGISFMLKI